VTERENHLAVRWNTEHEEADVSRLIKPVRDDFAIYLDRNGWEIRMKPACRPDEYDDPEIGWEWLWPMDRKTDATPLWASDHCAEGPERKIAYQPYPRADEVIFGFGYDNEPPDGAKSD
jgi:hypothetical protein